MKIDEWCVIGRDGFIVRIGAEDRARTHAAELDRDYPHDAPHEAVRLVTLDEAERILAAREGR